MSTPGESSPEVIAYRLGQIELSLREIREESITPAVYNVHRQADLDAQAVYRAGVESRFQRLEEQQIHEDALRQNANAARRTLWLAIGLAVFSPFAAIIVGRLLG